MRRQDWMRHYPSQVVVVVNSVTWATRVANILSDVSGMHASLGAFHAELVKGISELATMVDTALTAPQRRTVEAQMTLSVHERGVVERLLERSCRGPGDFEWQSQLRCEPAS
jgi:hypothetical protein